MSRDIGRQLLGQLAIGEPAIAVLGPPPPRAEMHLVDRDRRVATLMPCRQRRRTAAAAPASTTIDAVAGRSSAANATGSDFSGSKLAVAADDLVLVLVAGARAGNEDFPEAVAAHAHGVAPAVPEIEIADHADAPRVRREHREGDAVDAVEHASDARRACRRAADACLRRADVESKSDRIGGKR